MGNLFYAWKNSGLERVWQRNASRARTLGRVVLWTAAMLPAFAGGAENLSVPDGNFEAGTTAWSNLDGELRVVRPDAGRDGSAGLFYSRPDPLVYELVSVELPRPEAGVLYRFGAWIKPGDDLQGAASVCVEVMRGDEYLYGVYAADLSEGKGSWQLLEHNFTTQGESPEECRYFLRLYLRPEAKGSACFDDAFFVPAEAEWVVALAYPTHNRIAPEEGKFVLSSATIGRFFPENADLRAHVTLRRGAETLAATTVPVEAQTIRGTFGAIPPGEAQLVVDMQLAEGKSLGAATLPVEVRQIEYASNACVIDEFGRAIVDGKPFLPIGLYGDRPLLEDLDTLAASAFNCYLPYKLMDEWEPTREFMDRAAALQLKVIFSIKNVFAPGIATGWCTDWKGMTDPDEIAAAVVEAYKDHPALLAWYICDESPRTVLPALTERRKLVNALDADHPTWSVFYQRHDIPYYLESLDVLGVDPYPIMSAAPGNLALVDQMGRRTEGLPMALWAVPQAHSLGHYDPEVAETPELFHQKFRYPSEDDMTANALLQAIYGAKGFIFYSLADLKKGPDADQFNQRWPQLCRVAERLEALAPFLLNVEPISQPEQLAVTGTVRSRLFSDGQGNQRLLVVGVESGKNEALLRLDPACEWRSATGLTRNEEGLYRFCGEGISWDILSGTHSNSPQKDEK